MQKAFCTDLSKLELVQAIDVYYKKYNIIKSTNAFNGVRGRIVDHRDTRSSLVVLLVFVYLTNELILNSQNSTTCTVPDTTA